MSISNNKEKLLIQLEKRTRYKLKLIEDGVQTPQESKIGFTLNAIKNFDEVLFSDLVSDYKEILSGLNLDN